MGGYAQKKLLPFVDAHLIESVDVVLLVKELNLSSYLMAQGTHEDVVELVAGVGESDLATVLEDHLLVAVDDESC